MRLATAVTADEASDGNAVYLAYIEAELKTERERKSSLDTRGANVVTSSGALFAVLAGLSTLGRASTVPTPAEVPSLLVLALLAFFSAGMLGIVAQWNRAYPVTKPEGLHSLLEKHWVDSTEISRRRIALSYVDTLTVLRRGNKRKELALRLGYCCQAIAMMFLGPVVFLLLVAR
jgi:hypothetical protein